MLVLSAQSTDVLLAADHIFGLSSTQLPQSLVSRQGNSQLLVVAVMPHRRRSFVFFAVFGVGRGLGEISSNRIGSGVQEEKLYGILLATTKQTRIAGDTTNIRIINTLQPLLPIILTLTLTLIPFVLPTNILIITLSHKSL